MGTGRSWLLGSSGGFSCQSPFWERLAESRVATVTEHRDSVGVQLSLMSHCLLYSGLRVSASLVLIHHI